MMRMLQRAEHKMSIEQRLPDGILVEKDVHPHRTTIRDSVLFPVRYTEISHHLLLLERKDQVIFYLEEVEDGLQRCSLIGPDLVRSYDHSLPVSDTTFDYKTLSKRIRQLLLRGNALPDLLCSQGGRRIEGDRVSHIQHRRSLDTESRTRLWSVAYAAILSDGGAFGWEVESTRERCHGVAAALVVRACMRAALFL
ncbi:hypothetical protein BHE74_00013329 [Ensete ventricosum]|nr:hypothetical protein BHE74_00013329 [Ensete ventricosum]